ncbi:MAG: hypothetical protein JSU80_00125 [Deltaproteobacteria bacterium]|nr:MAG: hypothetical protein JSU80_00125 [Deltaproteobacteria bacterium]
MGDYQKPRDCVHYPSCQDLETVSRDIPASFSGLHAIVLQREARAICLKCQYFEPKDLAGAA